MASDTHAPLTDPQVRSLSPGPTPIDIRDGLARGLILTVLPSGRKQFAVRYLFQGKHRRLLLGEYSRAFTLAKARRAAEDVRTAIRNGRDPVGERKAAKAKRTDTISALIEAYLEEHARPKKRTADEDERALTVEVLPHWGTRSVKEIKRADVKALLRKIVKRGSPIMANRVLSLIRKVLNYAVDEEWIEANPAARIPKPAQESSRARVLTDEELRRIWRLLSNLPATSDKPAPGRKRKTGSEEDPLCPVSGHLAALLKVRLLAAQRGGETAKMHWSDLDLQKDGGWWTIPGTDTKNGEAHRVWLVKDAVDVIRGLQPPTDSPREYVFAGAREGSVTERAKKAPSEIARVLKIDFKGHDFRRTAATRMAEAGIPREHIAFVLNHVQGGPRATQVYDRYNRDREKQVALETWARVLMAIRAGRESGKVLPFATV